MILDEQLERHDVSDKQGNLLNLHPSSLSRNTDALFFSWLSFPNRPSLKLLHLEVAIALIEVADINAFHKQRTVVDAVGEGWFE